MSLQSTFKQFLASPSTSLLAENAAIQYITTLITIHGPAEIIKHLSTQGNQLKKKQEEFLDVVEGQNALAAEVETTLEFISSGGAYLPGLDDNFLADRTVTFPIIYIVSFDESGKITQIRQNWDQGSLLKLIDVIGKTGRNWPIRDGKDQAKLIANSVKSAGRTAAGGQSTASKQENNINRSRENSTNVTRDPHSSLSLFASREQAAQEQSPKVIAPRASAVAKPPPRDLTEIFGGGPSDRPARPTTTELPTRERSQSPTKHLNPKSGGNKNYQPIRLFDMDGEDPSTPQKERRYISHPKKYEHFDFGDGSDAQDAARPAPAPRTKSKHGSQWDFDDFNTPAKVVPTKVLGNQEVRHWGEEDSQLQDSPVKREVVNKPRKDAETHFEFVDDGVPTEDTRRLISRPKGTGHNTGLGLYENHLFAEDEASYTEPKQGVLGNIANVQGRRKDFDSQFAITDESPSVQEKKSANANQKENVGSPIRPATSKGGPLSETTNSQRAGVEKKNQGISIGGDGMGGKKGAGRSWGFGDESDGEDGPNGPGGAFRKGMAAKKPGPNAQATGGDFWDF